VGFTSFVAPGQFLAVRVEIGVSLRVARAKLVFGNKLVRAVFLPVGKDDPARVPAYVFGAFDVGDFEGGSGGVGFDFVRCPIQSLSCEAI